MGATRVVVADDGSCDRATILGLAEAAGFAVVGEAGAWGEAAELVSSRTPDAILVFFDKDPDFVEGISTLQTPRPIVVAGGDFSGDVAAKLASSGAATVLPLETTPDLLRSSVLLAVARARDLEAAHSDAEVLRDQLETRKMVERAKGILMRRLGLSEEDAFRKLQRASQDENRKMRDIAEAVVRTEKLFGAAGLAQGEPVVEEPRERSYVRHSR
jgi:response regulator NasT